MIGCWSVGKFEICGFVISKGTYLCPLCTINFFWNRIGCKIKRTRCFVRRLLRLPRPEVNERYTFVKLNERPAYKHSKQLHGNGLTIVSFETPNQYIEHYYRLPYFVRYLILIRNTKFFAILDIYRYACTSQRGSRNFIFSWNND